MGTRRFDFVIAWKSIFYAFITEILKFAVVLYSFLFTMQSVNNRRFYIPVGILLVLIGKKT